MKTESIFRRKSTSVGPKPGAAKTKARARMDINAKYGKGYGKGTQGKPYDVTTLPNYNPALPFSGLTPAQQRAFEASSSNYQRYPAGAQQKSMKRYDEGKQMEQATKSAMARISRRK